SSRRRHTRSKRDWSSDVCSSDLAIEAATGYGSWMHGEAVAAGMVLASRLSVQAARLPVAAAERVAALVRRARLPADPPRLSLTRSEERRVGKELGYRRWAD